jgi:hypothetical protein
LTSFLQILKKIFVSRKTFIILHFL